MILYSLPRYFPLLLILGHLTGCNPAPASDEAASPPTSNLSASEVTVVQIMPAVRKVFDYQIEASGKVGATQYADLRFKQGGYLAIVRTQNGQRVEAGEVLAELDPTDWELALRQAHNQKAIAREAYIKEVTEFGGNHLQPNGGITPELDERIKARTNFHTADLAIELAQINLAHCQLRSPIAGTVADMQLKKGNFITASQVACAVYSANQLEVALDILESELPLLRPGQRAAVAPLGQVAKVYAATVADINPKVDANGMLKVRLRIVAPQDLFVGMNVRATVYVPQHKALVVPREAIVVRSGRKVVFTEENGLAKWHYVTTGLENTQEVEITEGLKMGEKVVVVNNLQLAHDSPVKVGGGK